MSEGKPEWLLGQHDEGPGNKVWNIPRLRQHGSKHEMHEKPTLETRRQKDGMPPMHQKAYHSPALSNQEHVNDSAMHVWALLPATTPDHEVLLQEDAEYCQQRQFHEGFSMWKLWPKIEDQ